jgi:hypothetical protein
VLDGLADPQVEIGQDIRPTEPEEQEHLSRPSADTFDTRECVQQRRIFQLVQLVDGQGPIHDSLREIFDVDGLGTRQADRSQLLVWRCQQFFGRRSASAKECLEPAMNRAGGLARQLLKHDRSGDGSEVGSFGSGSRRHASDFINQLAEHRVDAPKVRHRFRMIRVVHGYNLVVSG